MPVAPEAAAGPTVAAAAAVHTDTRPGPVRVAQTGPLEGAVKHLRELQKRPERVRTFCMLAHVDHGKTTLSDHLISSNGIISSSQAGNIKYLDCREDEIERMITMKASTISLLHLYQGQHFRCNLIDSPGHVDFSCEVSTAVRLSDGALVLVDAVDGLCSQTRSVLQQAYREKVRCCLVINKVDLLITKVKISPSEAYERLCQILQETNALMETFRAADTITGGQLEAQVEAGEVEDGMPEDDEGDAWFAPAKGNVLFSSSVDGWGFRPAQFAQRWSSKLGWSETALTRCLWGDFFLKTVKGERVITRKRPRPDATPMCIKLVLEPIWQICQAAGTFPAEDGELHDGDERHEKLAQICEKLGFKKGQGPDPARMKRLSPADGAAAVLRSWLPLSRAVLDMVAGNLPSPAEAQAYRTSRLVPDVRITASPLREKLLSSLKGCSADGPLMVFIAKMVDTDCLPGTALQSRDVIVAKEEGDEGTAFVGIARVFSGTLRVGQRAFVLEPRHRPGNNAESVEIQQLFMLMGRGVQPVDEVPAGNVCGIGGLGKHVLKSATLAESPECPGFQQMAFQSGAIIRQSIEPVRPQDLDRLRYGLSLLNKADPQVEVTVTQAGEHVLSCAGEVHAERCARDLLERYAKVELRVSEPLVGFRETIIGKTKTPVVVETPGGACTMSISAHELPQSVLQILDREEEVLRPLLKGEEADGQDEKVEAVFDELGAAFREAGRMWGRLWDSGRLWALGPKQCGTCALFAAVEAGSVKVDSVWASAALKERARRAAVLSEGIAAVNEQAALTSESPPPPGAAEEEGNSPDASDLASQPGSASAGGSDDGVRRVMRMLADSVVSGFDLSTQRGPMCEEPMAGVAFVIRDFQVSATAAESATLSGLVIAAVQRCCRQAFEQAGRRLMEPVYRCWINGSGGCLGKVEAVVQRRRGEIVDFVPQEGSDAFVIEATIPVVESFGLTQELRMHTSGLAQPQVEFDHWHRIPDDPFFVPRTEDELEDMSGHDVQMAGNLPKKLIEKVRQRKGLLTERKVVVDGEKAGYSRSAT
eukprot:Hpha_TRINITY_DN22798_c0_g1::TRINITY_DN22798_c0_g1_i1::g.34290::m.34290/K14536/RIA1; ribosome assembly protein 1